MSSSIDSRKTVQALAPVAAIASTANLLKDAVGLLYLFQGLALGGPLWMVAEFIEEGAKGAY